MAVPIPGPNEWCVCVCVQNLTGWTRRDSPLACHALVISRFRSLPIASLRGASAVKLLLPMAGKSKRISSLETACWVMSSVLHTHKGEEGHREGWDYHPSFSPLKTPTQSWIWMRWRMEERREEERSHLLLEHWLLGSGSQQISKKCLPHSQRWSS